MTTIQNNSDFLFIYEAINCNPNGDPDQENKPRMDYDTQTNLVTDTRLKRYIRDYFMQKGLDVFVSMHGTSKVSVDQKMLIVLKEFLDSEEFQSLPDDHNLKMIWIDLKNKSKLEGFDSNSDFYEMFRKIYKETKSKLKGNEKEAKAVVDKLFPKFNDEFLLYLTNIKYIDVRFFGSAVAVSGFPRTMTGAIQINWGYSLNEVHPVDSNSIVTIMNDDSSTFGKDYRIHYSLIAFHGVANKFAARTTGLKDEDMEHFRDGIWNAIPSLPTRSKLNQYPKLYLEIIYNNGYHNGHFGDLRDFVDVKPSETADDFKKVRKFNDLDVDFSRLEKLIADNQGEDKAIKEVKVKTAEGLSINA